jgi:hypothetical protein
MMFALRELLAQPASPHVAKPAPFAIPARPPGIIHICQTGRVNDRRLLISAPEGFALCSSTPMPDRPDLIDRRRKTQRSLWVALALSLITAGAFSYYWFLIRGPLSGARSHDFGEVVITGPKADVVHAFSLTNRTSHTIHIQRIVPDCGCVAFTPSSAPVEPGASVDLHAVMSVYSDGVKRVAVRLMLADDGVQFLHLKATGRRVESSLLHPDAPTSRPGESAQPMVPPPE